MFLLGNRVSTGQKLEEASVCFVMFFYYEKLGKCWSEYQSTYPWKFRRLAGWLRVPGKRGEKLGEASSLGQGRSRWRNCIGSLIASQGHMMYNYFSGREEGFTSWVDGPEPQAHVGALCPTSSEATTGPVFDFLPRFHIPHHRENESSAL